MTPLEFLKKTQNPDGGWGYFPGKKSWLEPTAWAMLALHPDPAAARAWDLIRQWQQPDGGWRPTAVVAEGTWATALVVTVQSVRGARDSQFDRAVQWLTGTKGHEGEMKYPWYLRPFLKVPIDQNFDLLGWPWRPTTSSWVEPTAHALVALRKQTGDAVSKRIQMGEEMLMDRRCVDGGWNYGNRRVLETDLESFPECTALALVGLHGAKRFDLRPSLDLARREWSGRLSPLARVWLRIALRLHDALPGEVPGPEQFRDVTVAALEAIGAPDGNWKHLKAEAA
jgi:hypothetical protein